MQQQPTSRAPSRVLVTAAVVAVVLAVAGPFVYINYLQGDAPERLGAATATTGGATAEAGASLDGTWAAGSGSQAGYRVKEVLFGQDTEAVGRTSAATGALTLHGTTRQVTVDVTVQRSGDTVQASGSIPVTFADYDIASPSFGPVTTEDSGEIEFLLALRPSRSP